MLNASLEFADDGKPNICNNWSGLRLLINLHHPIVEKFKTWIHTASLLGKQQNSILTSLVGIMRVTRNVQRHQSQICTCEQDVDAPLTRYKVVVQVVHGRHKAEFVFWDSECLQVIDITGQAFRKTMQEVGELRMILKYSQNI